MFRVSSRTALMTVGLAFAAGSAAALAVPAVSAPAVPASAATLASWSALTTLSNNVVQPERLCYWNYQDEKWIPADNAKSEELRPNDPRPIYRDVHRTGALRCNGSAGITPVPAADVVGLGAVLAAALYISQDHVKGNVSGVFGPPPASPD